MGSIHAQDLNDTTIANDTDTIDEVSIKPYSDLFHKINSTQEDTVELNESYRYDNEIDNESFIDGIVISKNLTIVGKNNMSIDGDFLARGFNIAPNSNVVLKNIIFKNGYSKSSGAAILVGQNSSLLIDNCTFFNNMVYNSNGGAIYGLEGTDIEIHSSEFFNNSATRVSKLPWKKFKKGMGSVICMRIGTSLKLFDSIIRDNIGYLTTILIITWDDVNINQSTLYVNNCTFENNLARTNAVIYLDEFGIAEIVNSVFRNNAATYSGGIISFDTSRSAVVKDCTFESNSAIKGGALFIGSYDSKSISNVTVVDSTFKDNYATSYGGAIYSVYGNTEIDNCLFENNTSVKNGGAIYAKYESIKIHNSVFRDNEAKYGGALLLKADNNIVESSSFIKNHAYVIGGAIYSSGGRVLSSQCTYSSNNAPKASNVYGLFNVKVTKYVASSGRVKLKIIISSPWKMPLSQKLKVKIGSYTSGWLKTDSSGKVVYTVPKGKSVTKKSLSFTFNRGFGVMKSYLYKNPGKISVSKTVKKSSKLKVTIKNSQTKKPIKKTYFKVKIYTGKKYKTFKVKSNSKGVIKISMKKFKKGNHKISIYLSTSQYYINKKYSFEIK